MARVFEGQLVGQGKRIGIVVSRFNELVSTQLLNGSLDCLRRHGVADDDISVVHVPGSFEIALAARRLGRTGRIDAIICLGAVIRGATPHFEYVAAEAAKGVSQVALELDLPVVFGVLTTDTVDQALERAGTKSGNKGFAAAMTALEMASLLSSLE